MSDPIVLSRSPDAPRGPSVLVVEDESSIAEPFAQALVRSGFRPSVAGTGAEALARFDSDLPDVVLLDLSLPDVDGRDLCRTIRGRSDVPILIITASGSVVDRVVGLELGADDYIIKPFAVGEVVARIRAVLRRVETRGSEPGQPPELVIGRVRIDRGARRVWVDGAEVELTRKEFDLLARLARDAGQVVSREDLMSDVWDVNWFGSTKTLDVHIGWLRRKLGDDPSHPQMVITVRGVGFRLTRPEAGDP